MATETTIDSEQEVEDDSPLRKLLAGVDRARKLTVWSLLVLAIGTSVSWNWSREIFDLLVRPLTDALTARGQDPRLVFTGLTEPFVLYFTVSVAAGLTLAIPAFAVQLYVVAAPRIRLRSAFTIAAFVLIACALFLAGLSFGYFVLIPFAVGYLLDVGKEFAHAITIRDFLRFTVRLLLAMGLGAQLPLIMFSAARVGLVNARGLLRWFPYAVVVAFVLAAMLTPPDGMSQFLVAVPLLVLYLVGVAVAAIAGR